MEAEAQPRQVEPPRGIFPARVDEKGRLKLPTVFQAYFEGLGEKTVFITTLDTKLARIYPISVWKENEKFLAGAADGDLDAAEEISFIAMDFGADSDVDSQGRVLVPQELRRQLGIENQPVWLEMYRGRVNVYSKELYDEKKRVAMENLAGKVKGLERKGLK